MSEKLILNRITGSLEYLPDSKNVPEFPIGEM